MLDQEDRFRMKLELENKVALVTGGSKGIGADIVSLFTREGVKVAFCARASKELSELKKKIEANSGICLPLEVDIFDPIQISECVKKVADSFGGIDILVNNVGGAIRPSGFVELSDSEWMKAYELNFMSVVRFTKACLPYLRKSLLKKIINISSIGAVQPGMFNPHYTATKAAVVNFTKYLSNVLAKEKILVNVVCPGPVHSDSWDKNIEKIAKELNIDFQEAAEKIEIEESAKIPLGIIGDGEQVANLVAFLASPLSTWTTGSCFHLNGGKLYNAY